MYTFVYSTPLNDIHQSGDCLYDNALYFYPIVFIKLPFNKFQFNDII